MSLCEPFGISLQTFCSALQTLYKWRICAGLHNMSQLANPTATSSDDRTVDLRDNLIPEPTKEEYWYIDDTWDYVFAEPRLMAQWRKELGRWKCTTNVSEIVHSLR